MVEKIKWYQSKVVWFNVISFVVLQAQFLMQFDWLPSYAGEILVSIVAIGNILLRIYTDRQIETKGD